MEPFIRMHMIHLALIWDKDHATSWCTKKTVGYIYDNVFLEM